MNTIPWTVIGVVFVALIAVVTVIVASVGVWKGGLISAVALLLIVCISITVIRSELKKNMQSVLEAQRIEAAVSGTAVVVQ